MDAGESNMFTSGDQIGSYILIQQLGEGNFGVVWLAENKLNVSPKKVAIKLLKHPDSKAIIGEVFTWAKAGQHPNILPIIDAKAYRTRHGEIPAIVTPYIPEGSLAARIQNVPIDLALDWAFGILSGLDYLHSNNIVHRDLKPANILLYQGSPLIGDFGIARLADPNDSSSAIMGTPLYMAPEAFLGERSFQTDMWSASVTIYQLLTGRLPFPDVDAIRRDAPPLPFPISVPLPVQQALFAALRKDPALRYFKSAIKLRDALAGTLSPSTANSSSKPVELQSTEPSSKDAGKKKKPRVEQSQQMSETGRKESIFRADEVEAKEARFIAKRSKGKSKERGSGGDHRVEVDIRKGKFDNLNVVGESEE